VIEKGNMTDAEYIAALIAENKKLKAEQAKLEKAIDILETKKEKLSVENECLKRDCYIYLEALILSKHRIFGTSSEHTEVEGQQSFFNEAETEYAEKTEEPISKTVKGYTRKSPKTKHDELIKNIETEVITCTIPDEEQICPHCGSQMKIIGKKYIREEVELIPAKLVVKKYYSNTYSCKKCEKKNMLVFLHGFVPAPCTSSFTCISVNSIMCDIAYVDGLKISILFVGCMPAINPTILYMLKQSPNHFSPGSALSSNQINFFM
jgi:hypothetical protein